jgi:hypothetical protein
MGRRYPRSEDEDSTVGVNISYFAHHTVNDHIGDVRDISRAS